MISLVVVAVIAGVLNGIGSSGGALMLLALISSGLSPLSAVFVNKATCLFGNSVSVFKLRKTMKLQLILPTLGILIAFSLLGSMGYIVFDQSKLEIIFAVLILFLIIKLVLKIGKPSQNLLKYFAAIGASGAYNGIFGVGMIPITASVYENYRGLSKVEAISTAMLLNLISDLVLACFFVAKLKVLDTANIIPTILSMLVSISIGNFIGSSLAIRIETKYLKIIQVGTLIALFVFLVLKSLGLGF